MNLVGLYYKEDRNRIGFPAAKNVLNFFRKNGLKILTCRRGVVTHPAVALFICEN